MFIIRKKDGSIKFAITNDYINQHSNNVNVVYFAIEDLDTAKWSADCLFTLPDRSTIVLAGTPTQFTYSGENYNGYKVPLSSPITMYAGTLDINARNYDEYGNILYSFPFEQTINATASADAIEVPITVAQYNSFMAMLTTYLNAYDSHLIRKYDTLALANADIANLALLSVVLIKNESGNYDLYRKNDATTLAKVSSQDFINLYNASIKSITNTLVDGVLTTQLLKENNTTLSALIDLKNAFYLKSQVYTKRECDDLFLTIQAMSQYATKDYVNSTFATISALTDTNTLAQSAYDLASSKANTYVFDTYDLMKTDLASASATKYHIGDNLLIVALDTPDYWVKKVNATQSGDYGYYEVAEQEVNLQGYQKSTDNSLITTDKTIVGAINETQKLEQIDFNGVSELGETKFTATNTHNLINGKEYMLNMTIDKPGTPFVLTPFKLIINGETMYLKSALKSGNCSCNDIRQMRNPTTAYNNYQYTFRAIFYNVDNVKSFYLPVSLAKQDIIGINAEYLDSTLIEKYGYGQILFTYNNGKFYRISPDFMSGEKLATEITLPYLTSISVATESALGGIKAKALTNEQNTQEVLISGEKLYSQATPIATSTIAGSVKVADKTGSGSFVEVMIDSTGKLYCPTIPTLNFTIVSTLPTTGESNVIYLVPTTSSSTNNYDEYIWVNNKWELLGGVAIDLTNYYTKKEIDDKVSALNNKDIKSIELTHDTSDNKMTISSTITLNDNTELTDEIIIPSATDTTAGLLTNTQNIKLNALPTADKVAQKFVINGTITNSVVAFNSLVVADLISAINSDSVIIFKPTNADIQDFIINTKKVSGTTYTLIGNYTINNSGVITNYELTITIVDNVAEGSISIVSGASVEPADYASANTQLNGLSINGTNFKLLDVKVNDGSSLIIGGNRSLASGASGAIAIGACSLSTASGSNSTAIGYLSVANNDSTAIGNSSSVTGDSSTALGNSSSALGSKSTALGYYSMASGNLSTAIGSNSVVYVPNWVSFDGTSDGLVRTIALKSTDNIFFRNENVDYAKTTQASYTSGKTLTEVLNTKQDKLVSGTNIKTINGNSLLGSGNLTISGGGGSGSDTLVRINIKGIIDETTGINDNSLVFVGYRNLINTALEKQGLVDLDTLSADWNTLMAGERATEIWRGLLTFLSVGVCFSCFYRTGKAEPCHVLSPIIDIEYLGYILLNGTTPEGHIVFNDETTLKAAFANSTMELDG